MTAQGRHINLVQVDHTQNTVKGGKSHYNSLTISSKNEEGVEADVNKEEEVQEQNRHKILIEDHQRAGINNSQGCQQQ